MIHIMEPYDIEDEEDKHQEERNRGESSAQQKKNLIERLKKLDKQLQLKFANNWVSVRKAFLDLDYDYDGKITV